MIELPEGVVPNAFVPALIDYGGVQTPPLGGSLLRVDRLGNRFRASVTLPPIPNADLGRVVVSRLIRAKSEGLRLELPLCGVDQGSPGATLVKGAGQAGTSLLVDGFRSGYGLGEGYWFSIETAGQHYLYNAAAPGQATAGEITIATYPPLRKSPADNDVVHLQKPMIEGLVMGEEQAWEYSLAHNVSIGFELMEAR